MDATQVTGAEVKARVAVDGSQPCHPRAVDGVERHVDEQADPNEARAWMGAQSHVCPHSGPGVQWMISNAAPIRIEYGVSQ